jgi:uncharacterized membrane protein
MAHRSHLDRYASQRRGGFPLGWFAVAIGAVAIAAFGARQQGQRARRPARTKPLSDAPPNALREGAASQFREKTVVGRTVTINRPRHEVYGFWRAFANLPRFLENVKSIEVLDSKRSRWVVIGPGETDLGFDATITEDRPNELIAWQSDPGTFVRNSGRIVFRDGPNGRGTEVEATIAYDPPGGEVGRLMAKLFQREPGIQTRRDLKRFKQFMETGEIATAEPGPAAPRA